MFRKIFLNKKAKPEIVSEQVHVNPYYVSDAATAKEELPKLFAEMKVGLMPTKDVMKKIKDKKNEMCLDRCTKEGTKIRGGKRKGLKMHGNQRNARKILQVGEYQ